MSNMRALLVALTILAMMIAPVLVPSAGPSTPSGLNAFAIAVAAPAAQDDDDEGNDDEDGNADGDDGNNDGVAGDDDDGAVAPAPADDDDDGGGDDDGGDDDGGDDDGGDDDGGDDDGGDDDGGDDDGDDGGDGDDDGPASPFVPGYSAPSPRPAASADCSTPGQQMGFTSSDGTVSVTVYGNMPQGVRIRIRKPVDPGSVPAVPGQQVDALLFEIVAETCDGGPLARLPSEVNLGVRYTDGDAAGLNEANFKIARVDQGAWKATEKQAPDPGANFVSATISDTGFYVVHVP